MFLSGVIEGFYGPPWSHGERLAAFEQIAAAGLNTYLYCPKDDLHHRAIWRVPYGDRDADALRALIDACHARGLAFLYGIGPGLDLRYGSASDRAHLRDRCGQVLDLGCDGLALLFDDIPDRLDQADLARWGSLAGAQADVVNDTVDWARRRVPGVRAAFCPTPYCERMVQAGHGGPGYLETLGAALDPSIDVFWTGPEIVSREITVEHVRDVAARLRRPPLIWDNLHANDYDLRRMYLGPYSGRPAGLRTEVRGILSNPNTEFALNRVAVQTLGAFVHGTGDWDPSVAYRTALRDWLPDWETVSGPIAFDDLVRFADCYYLPYEEGPHAERLMADAVRALTSEATDWRRDAATFHAEAVRLRDLCARLATLRERPLFHALGRRAWELREELDLLARGVEERLRTGTATLAFRSDFHRPRTYRGGTVARLQRLLAQHEDGTFTPVPPGPQETGR